MGIREKINQRQGLTAAVTGCIVAMSLAYILWQFLGGKSHGVGKPLAFYSDDDGDSWFIAEMTHAPPFDHNGKPAVIAFVYRCGATGKPFVGYLMKYDEKARGTIEAAMKDTQHPMNAEMAAMSAVTLVKKPHGQKWIPDSPTSPQFQAASTPVCPSGESGPIMQLSPSDPDNGAKPQ